MARHGPNIVQSTSCVRVMAYAGAATRSSQVAIKPNENSDVYKCDVSMQSNNDYLSITPSRAWTAHAFFYAFSMPSGILKGLPLPQDLAWLRGAWRFTFVYALCVESMDLAWMGGAWRFS